jgi:hypothetical protein
MARQAIEDGGTAKSIAATLDHHEKDVIRIRWLLQRDLTPERRSELLGDLATSEQLVRMWQKAKPRDEEAEERTRLIEKIKTEGTPKGTSIALLAAMHEIDPETKYSDMNCTEFLESALRKAGFKITEDVKKRIHMSDVPPVEIVNLVDGSKLAIAGAASALIRSEQGNPVTDLNKVRPGDVVQYWYKHEGKLLGHGGIIEKSYGGGVVDLYGSHKSKGGVGTLVKLRLGDQESVFVARPPAG